MKNTRKWPATGLASYFFLLANIKQAIPIGMLTCMADNIN